MGFCLWKMFSTLYSHCIHVGVYHTLYYVVLIFIWLWFYRNDILQTQCTDSSPNNFQNLWIKRVDILSWIMSNGARTEILIIISSIYFCLSRFILSIAYQIKYITWKNALPNTHVGYLFFVSSTCMLIFLIEIVNIQSHGFNTISHFYMLQGLKISLLNDSAFWISISHDKIYWMTVLLDKSNLT